MDAMDATTAAAVVEHIRPHGHVIVPLANGEPVTLLDAIEAHADDLVDVRVHQMHALHDRPYLHGAFPGRLRHVSYFLSHITRPCFAAGTVTAEAAVADATGAGALLGSAPSASARDRRLASPLAGAVADAAAALLSLSSATMVAACDDAAAGTPASFRLLEA